MASRRLFLCCKDSMMLLKRRSLSTLSTSSTSRAKEIRHHVGVVQQDNFIFRGTVSDNIGLGDSAITEEQIQKACEKTGYMSLLTRTGKKFAQLRG